MGGGFSLGKWARIPGLTCLEKMKQFFVIVCPECQAKVRSLIAGRISFKFEGWTRNTDFVYSFVCPSIHEAVRGLSRLATVAREIPPIAQRADAMVV